MPDATHPGPDQEVDYDPAENPIRRAISSPDQSLLDDNPIRRAASGDPDAYAKQVLAQAERDGWKWDRIKSGLEEVNADPDQYAGLRMGADLTAARKKVLAGGRGLSASQSFRRDYMPFSSLTSLNFLPDIQSDGRFFGGRVVGESEYRKAVEKFKSGDYTEADVATVATYEHAQQSDKDVKERQKDAPLVGVPLLRELGSLGKIGGEVLSGGYVAGKVPGLAGRILAGAPKPVAAVATPGVAPAIPAAASKLLPMLSVTARTPSLYVTQAQQNNAANEREANSWKGYPTAFGYGYANMLVLGRLQKGVEGAVVTSALKKGVAGVAEMQGVDIAAGLADQFLPKAYQIKPTGDHSFGTIGEIVKGYGKGGVAGREQVNDALRGTAVQVLAFGTFAAMHGRPEKGTGLAQEYADSLAAMKKAGVPKREAADKVAELHLELTEALKTEPYMTQRRAKELLAQKAPPELKTYAERLADVFESKYTGPTLPVPTGEVTDSPEARVASADAMGTLAETMKRVESEQKAKTPPTEVATVATKKKGPIETRSPDPALDPSAAPDRPPDAKPGASNSPPVQDVTQQIADRLGKTREWVEKNAGSQLVRAARVEADPDMGLREIGTPDHRLPDAKRMGEGHAIEFDVRNMKGLADKIGSEAAVALSVEFAEAVRAELKAAGATEVRVHKVGGDAKADEYGALAKGLSSDAVASALKKAEARIAAIAAGRGVGGLPHTKAGRESGVGIQAGVAEFKASTDPRAAFQEASEASKAAPPEVATVASPKKSRLGGVTKKPKPLATGEVREVEPGVFAVIPDAQGRRVLTDNKALATAVAEYAKADTTRPNGLPTRSVLHAFIENIDGGDPTTPRRNVPKTEAKEEEVARRIASILREAATLELPVDTAALERVAEAAGLKKIEGETFDGLTMKSATGVPTGSPVRVVVPGWEMTGARRYVAAKAVVEPLATVASPEAFDAKVQLAELRGLFPGITDARLADGLKKLESLGDRPLTYEDMRAAFGESKPPEVATVASPGAKPADSLSEITTRHVSDWQSLRDAFPGLTDAKLAEGLAKLEDAGKIHLYADANPEAIAPGKGVSFDGGTYTAFSPREGLTESDLKSAFGGPKVATVAIPEAKAGDAQLWQMLTKKERRAALESDPDRWQGFDVNAKDPANAQTKILSGTEGMVEAVKKLGPDDGVTAAGKAALVGMLGRGASLRTLGREMGLSQEAVRKAANQAFAVMSRKSTAFSEHNTLMDLIRAKEKEATDQSAGLSLKEAREQEESREAGGGRRKTKPRNVWEDDAGAVLLPSGHAAETARGYYQKVKDWWNGRLPSDITETHRKEVESQLAAYAFDVQTAVKDFKRALADSGVRYEKLTDAQIDAMNVALNTLGTGDPAVARPKYADGSLIPRPVVDALSAFRRGVDKMLDPLEKSGAVPPDLMPALRANEGFYLRRQYQIFDPKLGRAWAEKVQSLPQWDNALAWMYHELTPKERMSPDAAEIAEGRLRVMVGEAVGKGGGIGYEQAKMGRGQQVGKRTLEVPELRALFGEYTDPVANYANSVMHIAHVVTARNFQNRIAREQAGKLFFDTEEAASAAFPDPKQILVEFAPKDAKGAGPLAGKFTTLEFKEAMDAAFAPANMGEALRLWMKLQAASKFSKVVVNQAGQERNLLSNVLIAVAHGHFKLPAGVESSLKVLTRDTPETRKLYREYIERGLVGEGLGYQDFVKTWQDGFGDRKARADQHIIPDPRMPDAEAQYGGALRVATVASGIKGWLERAYKFGDSFWKVRAFEIEAARREKVGMSREAARAEAAEKVRNYYPTYSKLKPGLQSLRPLPFAPFISFQAEMVRVTKNAVVDAVKDMRSDNPAIRKMGHTRAVGLAAAFALPWAMAMAARGLYNVTPQQDDDVRRFLPEYQKSSRLLYTGRDKDGNLQYDDLSRTIPHAYLVDPVLGMLSADSPEKGAENFIREIGRPFTQEEMVVRPLMDVARNQKDQGGKVYNPTGTRLERGSEQGLHLLKEAFMPGGVGPARRGVMALTGQEEQKTGQAYTVGQAFAENVLGQRDFTLNLKQKLEGKGKAFNAALNQAEAELTGLLKAKGTVNPQELEAARLKGEERRKRVIDEFKKDVDAAERLGLSREQVRKTLKDAGLSDAEVRQAVSGEQKPYQPQMRGDAQQKQRAGEVRRTVAEQRK